MYDINNELFLEYKYNKDLFEKNTIERMMMSYTDIARKVATGVEWSLSQLLAPPSP
jgi:hypothetical protein